jgi:transcriptional regulator with XRE-family HTH domain
MNSDLRSISPAQLRAARSLVDRSIEEIANLAGISRVTLSSMERGRTNAHDDTIKALLAIYDKLGVVFTGNNGVRERDDLFRLIEGQTPYIDLLEDMYATMKGTQGEILFFYVDNSLSPQAVIDIDLRMRKDGIRFRSIIAEDNPYCLFPLKEYRCVPRAHFRNNPMVVYADKVAVMIDPDITTEHRGRSAYLVRNASYAEVMRHSFDLIWLNYKMPKTNLAKVTYD